MKSLEPDDPRREDLELIIKEAARTKEIVQGLLSFARETKLRPGPTNMNEVLQDVLGLVANQSLFHNIKIKKVFAAALPTITADWAQLKQVFLNILLNAAEAMEGKGHDHDLHHRRQAQGQGEDPGYGSGHTSRDHGEALFPFLYHEGEGDGSRPCHLLRHHRASRGEDRRGDGTGKRQHLSWSPFPWMRAGRQDGTSAEERG